MFLCGRLFAWTAGGSVRTIGRDGSYTCLDTVSKNGTFILNVPGMPDGTIDSKEIAVLDGITAWMQANGEGIYETRPWKIYGEGPHSVKARTFQGNSISQLDAKDVRFTRNKASNVIYAHVLGWPAEPVTIQALGSSDQTAPGKVAKVELLGTGKPVIWKQANDAHPGRSKGLSATGRLCRRVQSDSGLTPSLRLLFSSILCSPQSPPQRSKRNFTKSKPSV